VNLAKSFLLLIVLTGCAHQPESSNPDAAGFFSGILHGILMLPSMVGSIFFDIRIYEFPNTGFFYDLGFIIGVFWSLVLIANSNT
jgi:hypothetical protein